MTLTEEEITLLRPLDRASTDRAMLSLAEVMEEAKEDSLFNRCAGLILKLDTMTEEEFSRIDFAGQGKEGERSMDRNNNTEVSRGVSAGRETLTAAMEAAGYVLDTLESTDDHLRFYGNHGELMTMNGWQDCEGWLNGVVFDDPEVSDRVQYLLHPERFPELSPQKAALRSLEDMLEQNDNHFDGIINNMPTPEYPEEEKRKTGEQDKTEEEHQSVLLALEESREQVSRATGMEKGMPRQTLRKERGILLRA